MMLLNFYRMLNKDLYCMEQFHMGSFHILGMERERIHKRTLLSNSDLFPVSKKDYNYEATRLHFENLVKRYENPIIILNLIKVNSSIGILIFIYYEATTLHQFLFSRVLFIYLSNQWQKIEGLVSQYFKQSLLTARPHRKTC